MTSSKGPRRISTIRYVPVATKGAGQSSPLVGVAVVTAIGIAIALLAVTISAAQAVQ